MFRPEMLLEKTLDGLGMQIAKVLARPVAKKNLGNTMLKEKMDVLAHSATIANYQLKVSIVHIPVDFFVG